MYQIYHTMPLLTEQYRKVLFGPVSGTFSFGMELFPELWYDKKTGMQRSDRDLPAAAETPGCRT